MVRVNSIPQWLEVLQCANFFVPCLVHHSLKNNDVNRFCLDCCVSLCPHCLLQHVCHCRIQIRRYLYQDVIRLHDAEKLMDCSSIQPYTTNSAKVVFLIPRPPVTKRLIGSGNICITCERNLQNPYLFCSISCKVHHIVSGKSEEQFYTSESPPNLEDEQMTPDSILPSPVSSSYTGAVASGTVSVCSSPSEMLPCINRRKGKPQRSPLY